MPVLPCALAIGGLDPGGGAGIVADLRAFAAAGAFGCAAAALITVQSTAGLVRVRPVAARDVEAQSTEVLAHQRVRAIKTGALGNAANVRVVARILARHPEIPAVVDTPIRPTRGRGRLLAAQALEALRDDLLPRAMVATVNVAEAEALLGARVRSLGDARDAAHALARTGPRAVVVKGGHLEGAMAVDVVAIDGAVVDVRSRRLALPPLHGTGCTFASLVAGRLAHAPATRGARLGRDVILAAVRWAKRTHHLALARAVDVGAPAGKTARVVVF
jgi:hydroxymethylpyrimidine/phosphomethylpyrimidine kinase